MMGEDEHVLAVEGLSVAYRTGGQQAEVLRDVSLAVRRGKTMAIVGESGSGKTTLAQCVMGLLPPSAAVTQGAIWFSDRAVPKVDLVRLSANPMAFRALRGGRIGLAYQEPSAALSPVYTVGALLVEALLAHKPMMRDEAAAAAKTMLRRVGFERPEQAFDRYPFELSGGLKQRAMIAAALICEPALLIADEPTSALDVTVQAQLLKLLRDLQDELGMSVLLITHDLGVVATIADDMTVLYRGKMMERGPARDLLKDPHHPYLRGLMRAGPSMRAETGEALTPLRPIKPPAPEFLGRWSRQHEAPNGEPVVRMSNLVKRFGARRHGGWWRPAMQSAEAGHLAVDRVSLDIRQGECLALVGESGCGKSTICRIAMQILEPDAGEVFLHQDGALRALAGFNPAERTQSRRRLQYVFQDPFGSLNPRHTVRQSLQEPFRIHKLGTAADWDRWAQELLELVGLDARMLDRFPNAFSGGQRQRIAIARALALKPDVLICDEPVSALDVSVQAQIVTLLQTLKAALGLTYLFVTHNLALVRHIADRVAVMCGGRIVEIAPADTIFAQARHPYTQALIAAVPDTDPDRRLDLSALLEGRASDPQAWPAPFRLQDGGEARYESIGPDHLVAVA
jgi:peptide/nickel transport system ATP-binding protein